MLIAIDANVLTRKNRTGTEWYVFELLQEMMKLPLAAEEKIILYTSAPLEDEVFKSLPAGWSIQILKWNLKKGWTHGRLSWELTRRSPDIFFSPAHEVPLRHGEAKIITTVHDIAFRIVGGVYSKKGQKRHAWATARALKLADRILTVSETTKNDLIRVYKHPEDKITATPLAVRAGEFHVDDEVISATLHKYRLAKKRYIFTVGRVEKKKNIATLITAFGEYKKARGIGDPFELIIGGSPGFGIEEIKYAYKNSGATDKIRFLGYVPQEDVAPLIAGARFYAFPSYYEGFGIPALEAMAAGTPLAASDIPALREVAGEAALFASPTNTAAWTKNITRLARDEELCADLAAKGRARMKEFSWTRTAQQTLAAIRALDDGHPLPLE
jgi:glycosyltransferase involved in cell wall biosynthesis